MILNKEQQEAVTTTDERVLVVAGAGSGKTRVLTERIKHLLEIGVNPHEIVSITYTRLAADEMKRRLQDVPGVGDMFIGTIHAFANTAIRANQEELGLHNYKVFNSEIEIDLIKELIITNRLEHLNHKRFIEYKEMEDAHNRLLISDEQLESFLGKGEKYELGKITEEKKSSDNKYKTIYDLMAMRNIITFDEMLHYAIKYFEKSGIKLQHLLVDEFQDIGPTDYKFLQALSPINSFYVGDDYQAIYSFKGASVQIFHNAVKDIDVTKIYLKENYRNSQAIIDLGEKVISQASDYKFKETNCNNDCEKVVSVFSKGLVNQALAILKGTEENPADNTSTAILCRSNKDVMKIGKMLYDLGIPYSSIRKGFISTNAELERIINANEVKVMTVHQAKGLEFDNVIGYGKFPVVMPSWDQNDEERRVLYVLVTRARNGLILLN